MRAEIFAIGDEMITGQRVDTNSPWLAERLTALGHDVVLHTVVGDDLNACSRAFVAAAQRCEIAVITGGLGPTADDVTREALAHAAGVGLVLDEASRVHIEGLFARRGRPMPERNLRQAMFPLGATPIPNADGTAPGIMMSLSRPTLDACRVFALPGVPAEMRAMWQAHVEPLLLRAYSSGRCVVQHVVQCFGGGESQIEQLLPDLIRRGRNPRVGLTVHDATISLRIQAVGDDAAQCREAVAKDVATIRACLGSMVFGEGEIELQHVVCRELARRKETVAIAEWGTRGLLYKDLAALPDSENVVAGGVLGSHLRAFDAILGGQRGEDGAVPKDGQTLAAHLAAGARKSFGATYGIAVGPVPEGNRADTALASVPIALATGEGMSAALVPSAAHPSVRLPRIEKFALDMLRRHLEMT